MPGTQSDHGPIYMIYRCMVGLLAYRLVRSLMYLYGKAWDIIIIQCTSMRIWLEFGCKLNFVSVFFFFSVFKDVSDVFVTIRLIPCNLHAEKQLITRN